MKKRDDLPESTLEQTPARNCFGRVVTVQAFPACDDESAVTAVAECCLRRAHTRRACALITG
eukprot:3017882-Pleurochrysis_carterae.AAC.1